MDLKSNWWYSRAPLLQHKLDIKSDSWETPEFAMHGADLYVCIGSYGGILLPPTCKINYVNMQNNYVDVQYNCMLTST